MALVEQEPPAAADVGPDLAAADVDSELGGRALENHPFDRPLDDVLEGGPLAVLEDDDVLRAGGRR